MKILVNSELAYYMIYSDSSGISDEDKVLCDEFMNGYHIAIYRDSEKYDDICAVTGLFSSRLTQLTKTEIKTVSVSEIEPFDLFNSINNLPAEVQIIIHKYSVLIEDSINPYGTCEALISELNLLNYTCDYDLSGSTYGLRKLT